MTIIAYKNKKIAEPLWEEASMTVFPYHMHEFEGVRGDLRHIEETDNGCLAFIGKIPVILPSELTGKLQSLVGRRVSVLKLDGYHVRELE
jgi:hypothetical protein